MVRIYKTIKSTSDKIALLGFFAAALLIARFITSSRATIALSEPIKLHYTGLSVSIPTGPGWQSDSKWKQFENGFSLRAVFSAGSANPEVLVLCRYLLSPSTASVNRRFEQKASMVAGKIVKTGQTQTEDNVTIDWVRIEKPETSAKMIFGTATLPNDRLFELEVQQITGDDTLADELFNRIGKSLNFKDNRLLKSGSVIISKIKSKGVNAFLNGRFEERPRNGAAPDELVQQLFLLIKDEKDHPIGFTMDLIADYKQQEKFNIQAVSMFYIRGQQEQVTYFQSNNSFDEFAWKTETSGRSTRSGTQVSFDDTNGLRVKKLGSRPKEVIYQLGPAAIPDVLLDLVFGQLVKSNYQAILIDAIDAEGKIIPVSIYKTVSERANLAEENTSYLLEMRLLGRDSIDWIYLDEHKQIEKRLLGVQNSRNSIREPHKQQSKYILERTSMENILKQFPERAEYILQKNEALNQL